MKKITIILSSIILLFFVWTEYRHFYEIDNVTFTVWKRLGGKCYITPYKYWGLTAPKKDYIIAPNLGSIAIFIDKDSTLIIFDEDLLKNTIECHFINYKYRYIPYSQELDSIKSQAKRQREYEKTMPHIYINLEETYVSSH